MNTAPSRRAAAAAASSVLVLSACGSLSSGDDFLDQSPRSMAKTAFAEMRKVTSMRILGSGDNDSEFLRLDLYISDTSCIGRIKTEHGDVQVIKNPDGAWFRADTEFWRYRASSPRQADQVSAAYADSWIAVPEKDKLLKLCDLDAILGDFKLGKRDAKGTLGVGEVEDVSGTDAVPIHGRDGKDPVTVWIAVEAPHRVVKSALTVDPGLPDAMFFGDFGVDVDAQTPPKKDIVTIPGS